MSPEEKEKNLQQYRFPRVSGDEPESLGLVKVSQTFSPRERG